jgi:AcrR family transcriptional regulator
MTVFWRHGYEGASLASLTEAMGINSPSLYACFGSKEGLFKAVLERYDQRRVDFMAQVTIAPDAASVAETFLMGVVGFAADTEGGTPPGCLMLQGGISCGDKVIPDILAQHRAEKEAVLRIRFEQARDSGDLASDCDPAALARYLIVMSNGICVQAASGATAAELREVATLALAGWPGRTADAGRARTREPA